MAYVEPKLFIREKLLNSTFIISIDDIFIVRPESSLFFINKELYFFAKNFILEDGICLNRVKLH